MKLQSYAVLMALGMGLLSTCAHAVEPYQEYRKRIESSQRLTAFTDQMMGDSISLYNGSTEFSLTDIDIAGNNALPVQLTRRLHIKIEPAGVTSYNPDLGGAGNWDLDVPHISGMFDSRYGWGSSTVPSQRCSLLGAPQVNGAFNTTDIWQGNTVHIPGSGDRTMLLTEPKTLVPSDGQLHRWTTRERDAFTCIPMKKGLSGEGFAVTTTSGIRYDFDVAVTRAGGTMNYYVHGLFFELPNGGTVVRTKIYLLASKITDRFGNTVNFEYNDAGYPTSISSSDGRLIALTYANGRLSAARANGREWRYQYETGTDEGLLTTVVRPDASQWKYAYNGTLSPNYEPWDGGSNSGCTLKPPAIVNDFGLTITHPSGAIGAFHFSNARHYRSGIHASACQDHVIPSDGSTYVHTYVLAIPNYFDVMSLQSKTMSGPGLVPMTWIYDYGITREGLWGTNAQAGNYPCGTCDTEKLVTVAQSDGTLRQYRYGFLYALNEGRLLGSSVIDAKGAVQRTESTTYLPESSASGQRFFPRYGVIINGDDPSTAVVRPVVSQTTQQDAATFTMQADSGSACGGAGIYCFDVYGKPTRVIKSSKPN
ncbi:hypothetical protein IAE60_12940 [Pseudoxanthomonas mexicana]|uniref:RHS repeat protein n=1 Tax=Pseudoxanthomonas mexicana TaxID=128785 RepID=A0A7G9T9R9_PSEMX|nr:hypothetical protein [Pseudoxanthomonas mexicana]QNN76844.1 hypothetical protein IAE60_12940 [Pseudoxanthomonas mexicana]